MRTRILGAWLVGALPLAVGAQTAPVQEAKGAAQVGGTSTIDYVTLRAGSLGSPLRFGHVVAGSERVEVDGRVLQSGTDYGMDYETGVVYLKRSVRNGERMTVAYRYDPQGKASAGTSFTGVNKFGLSLAPGLRLGGGRGRTERAADGTVLSSNVFGWNNTLNFNGKTSIGGLMLYSERQKQDTEAGLTMDAAARPGEATTEQGASRFLLQNFRSNLMGGNVAIDYQEISKNFASAGSVRSAGYSDADVAKYMKERGLKRQGASISGMKFGQTNLGASFRQVGDAKGGIDWTAYSLQQGGFKFSLTGQKVDKGFTRFADLAEGDREQLAREAGLSRQNLAMEFGQKTNKLGFNSTEIKDDTTGKTLTRREARMDTGKIGLLFGEQEVDKAFNRVGSLTGGEQAQWGREVGAKRQWKGLTAALGGKATPANFAFNQLDLETAGGSFTSRDVSFASKNFTLDHVGLKGSKTGAPMGALSDAEGNAYAGRIGKFFNAGANDSHRQSLLAAGDLKRELTKVTGNLGKGASFAADSLKFGDGDKGGTADSLAYNSPKVQALYRHQDFGKKFTDASRLMEFERARLGTVAGMERTDISFGVQIDKTRKFAFGQTKAQDNGGDLSRTTLAYNANGLQISAAQRQVDKNFASAMGLVDPENSLLEQFRGFKERDLAVAYSGTPGLKVQAFLQDALNSDTKEARSVANMNVEWQVDKLTGLTYTSNKANSKDPLTTLFAQSMERMSLTHSFGKLGAMKFVDERVDNDGKNNAAPDMRKQYAAFEANLTSKTSLKTEQTLTSFSDGNKENISANTVSTAVAKNVGVSVTDVKIDRKGDDNDEKRVNYGFWYDLGKGLRLSYGYAQSLVGDVNGTGVETLAFGTVPGGVNPNTVGQVGQANVNGIMVGGGYGENTYLAADGTRTQAMANVALATAKPLKFGAFTDLKFNLSLDTAADYSQYLRENHVAGISGKLGKNTFAFAYRGQLANPSANPAATVGQDPIQAVDRTFALGTDPDPKNRLVVNGSVKFRTLPEDKEYMSRNVAVTARPLPGIEVTNQIQTNLEQANPNVLLGSSLLADRANRWAVNFKGNGDTSFGATWEEKINDATAATSTLSAVNLTLFQKSGSPLKLTYGLDEVDGNVARRQITRYSLQFDAKANATQTFSMFVGNVGYAYAVEDPNLKGDNWTMRLNYQIRF